MKRRQFLKVGATGLFVPLIPKIVLGQESVCFAVAGDFHLSTTLPETRSHYSSPERLDRMVEVLYKLAPDFVVLVGDLTMHSEFQLFKNWTDTFPCPSVWVPGNHDKYKGMWKHWWKDYAGIFIDAQDINKWASCSWFERNGWAFVIHDNVNTYMYGKEERHWSDLVEWIDYVLSTIPVPPERRLYFGHYPLLSRWSIDRTGHTCYGIRKNLHGKIRHAYFGHNHINYSHCEQGGTLNIPFHVVGMTTIKKCPIVEKNLPDAHSRALLMVEAHDDGSLIHTWHSLELNDVA